MNLTLAELNELLYCVSNLMEQRPNDYAHLQRRSLFNKLYAEILVRNNALEPEFDSAGFAEEDRIIDGQYKTTEIEQLMDAEANAVQRWG